jgi:hypothetical protein
LTLDVPALIFIEQIQGLFVQDRFGLEFSIGFKPDMGSITKQETVSADMFGQGPGHTMGKLGRGEVPGDKTGGPAVEDIAAENLFSPLGKLEDAVEDLYDILRCRRSDIHVCF